MAFNSMTVLSVIGTRPEALKMAPVLKELARHSKQVRSLVCLTGQHREMLAPTLDLFAIRPDYNLEVMRPNQSLGHLTSILLERLEPVIQEAQPDWVVAQGDTTTVLATGLSAHFQKKRFAHVEAGLRTGDKLCPFPEELNRRVADTVADLHFAPTVKARDSLLKEGHPAGTIHVTGNTIVDALLDVSSRPFDWSAGPLPALRAHERIVLVTAHRRENFGEPLDHICEAIHTLATSEDLADVAYIFPVHLNPNVHSKVYSKLGRLERVRLLEPLDYLSMVHLMKRASVILTDSGGIQEEAPSLGVPVVVMREKTERPEGVESGLVRLAGTAPDRIIAEVRNVLKNIDAPRKSDVANPYGDGKAAQRIVSVLLNSATENKADGKAVCRNEIS